MSDVFLKDSIYCAIGLGSHDLYGSVDFDSWLRGQLTQDVQNPDPRLVASDIIKLPRRALHQIRMFTDMIIKRYTDIESSGDGLHG